MDKLNLDLDDLEVSSFTTAPEQDEAEGTVRGNGTARAVTECEETCQYTECFGTGPCLQTEDWQRTCQYTECFGTGPCL